MSQTKSLSRKVGEGTLWFSGGDFMTKVIGLGYLFLILNYLSVYEYGLVKLALSIPAILSILSLGSLHSVVVADMVVLKEEGRVEDMRFKVNSYLSLMFMTGALATVVLFVATFFADSFLDNQILFLVRVLSLVFLIGPIRSLILMTLSVSHNFKYSAIFSVSEEVIKLLLVGLFLIVFDSGMNGVIIATVFSNLATTTLFLPTIFIMKEQLLEGKFFSRGFFDPFHSLRFHAKWSIFLGGLNNTTANLRPWIIQFFLGTNAVGIYGLAVSLLQPLSSLLPIGKVILPIVPAYTKKKEQMARLINSAIKYKLYGQILLAFLAIISLPILIDNYFPEYQESYWLFVALTFAFIPQTFSQMFGSIYIAFKLQKNLFRATAINSVMILAVLPVSVYFFGLYGAAVELFITQTAFMVGRFRGLKVELPDYSFPVLEIISFDQTDRWLFIKIKNNLFRFVKK